MTILKTRASLPLLGYDHSVWFSMAPSGVPADLMRRPNTEIVGAVNSPDIRQSFNKQGLEARSSTPEQLASMIPTEGAKNARLIKMTGLKAE